MNVCPASACDDADAMQPVPGCGCMLHKPVAQTASRYQNKLLSMLPCFDISVPRLNVPVVLNDLQGEPDLHDKTLCMQCNQNNCKQLRNCTSLGGITSCYGSAHSVRVVTLSDATCSLYLAVWGCCTNPCRQLQQQPADSSKQLYMTKTSCPVCYTVYCYNVPGWMCSVGLNDPAGRNLIPRHAQTLCMQQ
jgi:hypothetical protein